MTTANKAISSSMYSGSILVLAIVHLIESVAFTIPFSYFPEYAFSLGASVASIGLFFSSFMLASTLLSPTLGGLSDRVGRKTIIMWGLIGDVVLGVLTALTPSWGWLLLIRIANGAASAAATVPSEALLIDLVSPKKRGEASGFVMAMFGFGMSIGPIFGGSIQWATTQYGFSLVDSYRIPYLLDAALAFLAVILVAYKIKEPKHVTKNERNQRVKDDPKKRPVFSLSIRILLVASFTSGIGVGFIMPVSVLFFSDKFGIEPIEIGFIISVTGFISILAGWLAGRLADRVGRKPLIALGGITSRLLSFTLPFTFSVSQALVVLALRSLFFNVSHPALRALRADVVSPQSRGRIFGLFSTAFNAGTIVGPIIGTWLYSIYYGVPFFVNAIFGMISVLLILLFVRDGASNSLSNVADEMAST